MIPKTSFSYLAHIMLADSTVTELAGTKEFANSRECYGWLCQRAKNMGGWVSANRIEKIEDTPAWGSSVVTWNVPRIAAPKKEEPEDDDDPSIFGAIELFGEYTDRYSGATSVTYKVTKE